ncbi:MAG: hypothetical protein RL173_417 [Fibrobacterota bacterium]|jgi:hypothetical protein
MIASKMSNSVTPPSSSESASGRLKNTVWWRFALAIAIVAISTMWSLTTRTSGVEPSRPSLFHWKFWTRPLEWNPNARKPYLQGDLQALAISRPPQGKAWVYFGGVDGFVVRRGLDDEDWEPVPLPKSVEIGQIPTSIDSSTDRYPDPASTSSNGPKE